ncbi:MAG: glycosyltransferase family 4 protein, partial [Bacteroidales bacterium]
DIIQIEGLYLCPYIPIIRSISNATIAYRAHNIEHQIWQRSIKGFKNPLKKLYIHHLTQRLQKFEINCLNSYDCLVPISQCDAERLQTMGNIKPLHVTPTGSPQSKIASYIPEPIGKTLFHLGALDWYPNQEGLLWFFDNVWSKLLQKYPKLYFYLAGRNAPQWFNEKIDKYPNIENFGEIDNPQDFIRNYAIMVVPLLSGSGMRIKIIEGMAAGKAIVTTSIGCEGINVTNGKNIFIADTPEGFAEAIIKLIENPQLILDIGTHAKQLVETQYDSTKLAENLLNFYKSLQ